MEILLFYGMTGAVSTLDSKFIRFDHSGNSTLRSFSALLYILVYPLLPVGAERFTGTDGAHSFADDLVVQGSTFLVALVVYCTVSTDSEAFGLGSGINIGAQEEKLPAVRFLLPLDHLTHLVVVVVLAGVLVSSPPLQPNSDISIIDASVSAKIFFILSLSSSYKIKKVRQPKLTHRKTHSSVAATQPLKHPYECESRACIFTIGKMHTRTDTYSVVSQDYPATTAGKWQVVKRKCGLLKTIRILSFAWSIGFLSLLLHFPLGVFPLPLLALEKCQYLREQDTGQSFHLMTEYPDLYFRRSAP